MELRILLPAVGSFALVGQPDSEKKNSEFKSAKLCLKIDIVSHPTRVGGGAKVIEVFYVYK